MGLLEDALRREFTTRVAAPPALEDVAGQAIRRASAARRTRRTVGSLSAMVVVVLLGVTAFTAGGDLLRHGIGPGTEPDLAADRDPSATPGPFVSVVLPADVLNRDRIQAADGRVVSLAGLGEAAAAYKVSAGWLVRTVENGPDPSVVWLVDNAGDARQLAAGDETMVSPPTGTRTTPQIAWNDGDRLSLASYESGKLGPVTSTSGVRPLSAVRAVGDGLLLNATANGQNLWDMWFPDRGAYRSTTAKGDLLRAVLGTTADGSQLIALYGDRPCVGLIDPGEFTVTASVCGVDITREDQVEVSPDGRNWLVVGPSSVTVYDAQQLWVKPIPVNRWQVKALSGAWLSNQAFLVVGPDQVLRFTVGSPAAVAEVVTVPDAGVAGGRSVIEDLR